MTTFEPLPYEEVQARAAATVAQMTLDEKIALVGGDRGFFVRPMARLGTPEVYMTDATGGIKIRQAFDGNDLAKHQPEKSTAFPCPIALAATWNPTLATAYARAVGQECRRMRIGVLLGPGMNIYRHAQCGRNFEYFGEDPLLAGRMVAAYVSGLQSTGTIATLKHFLANNTDWFRRRSNSIVDERALHEIYMPAFEAGVNAGARAVMTAYNLVNGQWCGESEYVINHLLRGVLGFRWLVMSDWWSVYDGERLARSGQDLEMPHAVALAEGRALIDAGRVRVADLDRMCGSILATCFSMRLGEDRADAEVDFAEHERIARETARQGVVLLHNRGGVLPLSSSARRVLVTGPFARTIPRGGGSARVEGFNQRTLLEALQARLGDRLVHVESPSIDELRTADVVLCNVGTLDSEGYDRPFALPEEQERLVQTCVQENPRAVVIVNAGGGVRLTSFSDRAAAVLFAWYPGQQGNEAVAEILTGEINPSGKLPITIEREFADSPGHGYLPAGESLYEGFRDEEEKLRPVWDLPYREGVFVGYRWYDGKGIEPLFPFGHGASYTAFAYDDLRVTPDRFAAGASVVVEVTIRNVGARAGAEIVQVYVEDEAATVPRPPRELKGFARVELEAGQAMRIAITLDPRAFMFWHSDRKAWTAEPGAFRVHVGASSRDVRLTADVTLI